MKSSLINRKSQQGFTLIESLLTLFILTVGLLGVAGMQMEGLRSGDLAMQRSLVVVKTQEMMERIRATNQNTLLEYLAVIDATSAQDNGCNTSGTVCTPTQMAEHDIFMWQRSLQGIVPVLTAATIIRTPNTNLITVAVNWTDRGVAHSDSITSLIIYL